MTAQEIRKKYLEFFVSRGHKAIPRASLVPQDDPTTLFTGSGMQPLIPYLLGEPHPQGRKLVDSQTCFRAEDMDEVGNSRHTTFFEMLGNWSLGDYFKLDQNRWIREFLVDEIKLDPKKLFITCFIGDGKYNIPRDTESAHLWRDFFASKNIPAIEVDIGSNVEGYKKGMQDGRIFYYDASKNWWSRAGSPKDMPLGEPGGSDSEVFYDFGAELKIHENSKFKDKKCHPNCDCGRFLEIANSVFMTYRKTEYGFEKLGSLNVDFGGGLERIAAAVNDDPDMFQISLIKPIIDGLEELSGKKYAEHQQSMRVIADHIRGAVWLAVDGVTPSNKTQGYVLRRLIRRAVRFAFDLGIEHDLCQKIAPIVSNIYEEDFPEVAKNRDKVAEILSKEEQIFRKTLRNGLREFEKLVIIKGTFGSGMFGEMTFGGGVTEKKAMSGTLLFKLYDTYGFPVELSLEEAKKRKVPVAENWQQEFDALMEEQRQRSQTAAQGMFRGGLADASEDVVKLHTATHLMYQALKIVLGDHVVQRGSNITAERTRFDFSHPEKVTPEQIKQVEDIVNKKIAEDLRVSWKEESTEEALRTASGAFGDKYGDKVKVYTIGGPPSPFSREICGGPHVEHTSQIGEGGRKFKIVKEESSSAGVRRIKAVLSKE